MDLPMNGIVFYEVYYGCKIKYLYNNLCKNL